MSVLTVRLPLVSLRPTVQTPSSMRAVSVSMEGGVSLVASQGWSQWPCTDSQGPSWGTEGQQGCEQGSPLNTAL